MNFKVVNFDYTLMKENFYGDGLEDCYGAIYVGELCFDIVLRNLDGKNYITMDPYIGGIDDGYGYSAREALATGKYKSKYDVPDDEQYPYTGYDNDYILFDDQMFGTEREQVEAMERAIVEFIGKHAADLEKYATMETHVW